MDTNTGNPQVLALEGEREQKGLWREKNKQIVARGLTAKKPKESKYDGNIEPHQLTEIQ